MHCGTTANVFFISKADYEVYASMDAGKIDTEFLWDRLRPCLHHLDRDGRRRVMIALTFAYEAHHGQFRKSGEPFITHPVEVARILGELGLDADTIVSGLLHDTVEDTDRLSFEEIEHRFGADVRRIVEAETRLTKVVPTSPGECVKDVDFRHFFMCMSQDIRIVLVKLADRLHNMRTMDSMKSSKQKEKSSETLQVYAPLAGVLGLDSIKEEMEELSLRYYDPKRYAELKDHLKKLESAQGTALNEARETLKAQLDQDSLLQEQVSDVIISSRQKSIYSLYKLYKQSGWDFDKKQELRQVAQLHVLLETDESSTETARLCYYVMGIVHLLWSPIPGKMRDCVATPKPTSWKGLTTTVWPSSNARLVTPVEVLIQTSHMSVSMLSGWTRSNANMWMPENGNAAESCDSSTDEDQPNPLVNGKRNDVRPTKAVSTQNGDSESGTVTNRVNGATPDSTDAKWNRFNQAQTWVESFQKWQSEIGAGMSPREYVDCVRDDFLSPSVYVLTPTGESVQLPKGATVLDFAYHVQTSIGDRAARARVDGCWVGPGFILQNAQVVEIFTRDCRISHEHLAILRSRIPILQTTSAKRKLNYLIKQHSKELAREGRRSLKEYNPSTGPSGSCFWIKIKCKDRKGVLADVSRIFVDHGLNISRYTGHPLAGGEFTMTYHVHDPGGSYAEELSLAVNDAEGTVDVVTGCTIPNPPIDPLGWYYPMNSNR